jgi:4-hydroxy-tetrahydrodipicolinate reductase
VPKKSGKTVLKLALNGCGGRMGQEILALSRTAGSGFQVVAEVEDGTAWSKLKAVQIDVVVDFSSPQGLSAALDWCTSQGKPLVSGTTGISAAEKTKLAKSSAQIPILFSANMSLGIAAMTAMLNSLSALKDLDFQIDEAHHKHKKDRPSGTAILLQEKLQKVLGRKLTLPNSVRGGGIPGIHQVWAMGPDESLILQHTAFNRKVFAQGALIAAEWLFDKKPPGLYDLSDLYKLT